MAREKYRSSSASAMGMKQRRLNAEANAAEDRPQSFSELMPRGPLAVRNTVVGILRETADGGIVKPDPSFRETNFGDVRIARNDLNGAPFNMVVVATVLNPSATDGNLRGRITEVLGDIGNNDVRMMTVLRQFGLKMTFPDEVRSEVEPLPTDPTPGIIEDEIKRGRRDLRDLLTVTIDGEEAKDLDDAISIERLGNGYRLYVHIADVSHYVREGTALDDEAMLRGTSVYLVDRVIPMLPPKLSNGLCSLNPKVPRLALTAVMDIDEEGNTFDGDVFESVIESDRRMSYNECYAALFGGDVRAYDDLTPFYDMLWDMKRLTDILKGMRDDKGAINFNIPETRVILNDDGDPVDVMPYPINYCHGMIEQFMICANEFIARKFAGLNSPFVYRVHEEPDKLKIARFCTVAKAFGAFGKIRGKITPKVISDYMATIKDEKVLPSLDTVLLRSMQKARYDPRNLGHFGLASDYYCHFTSPIRRYPDLYIHRIIKSYLHGENRTGHFSGLVEAVAEHSSDMERNSVEAERQSVAVKVCEYMSDKIGQTYTGKISSVIGAGIFVELESSIEGFVAFRTMRDHYVFDDVALRAVGKHSGRILMIGQELEVVVASVDTELNRVDFVLKDETSLESSKKARPDAGKASDKIGRRKRRKLRGGHGRRR